MSRIVSLAEVVSITAPQVDPRDPMFQDLPLVNGENIESGTGRLLYRRSAASEGVISPKYLFEAGDILYSKLRPYLRKAVVADGPGLCSADMYPLRPIGGSIDPNWLVFLLLSTTFTDYASEESARARMPKLNREQLLRFRFTLPDIKTQRSIAARIATQFAATARARTAGEAAKRHVRALRNALVDEALGSVVGRRKVPLVELGSLADGDWILNADYAPTGVRLLQVGDVGSEVLRLKSNRFITAERAAELGCTLLRPGDLLISRMAEPIGRTCILPDLGYPSITAVDVTVFRPRESLVDRQFLNVVMNSHEWLRSVEAQASGATRPRISRTNLEALTVPFPPLHVQKHLVTRLSRRLEAVRVASVALDTQLEAIEHLPAALLRSAFETVNAA